MTWVDPARLEGRKGYCEGNPNRCTLEKSTMCPLFGLFGRPGNDGKRRVKGCGDPAARGKRNRAKGDSKARKARKLMRLAGPNTRHEEHLRGPVLTESKAGAQVGPIWTRYRDARAQAEASRAIGDSRPFVFLAHPDGTSEFLIVVSSRDWKNVVAAYAEGGGT